MMFKSTTVACAALAFTASMYASIGQAQQGATAAAPGSQVEATTAPEGSPVTASGQLQEIVVTATKVSTPLQNTPISVQIVDGAALSAAPTPDLATALRNVPSVQVTSLGNFGFDAVVRGIGPGILGGQPGISTLYDGVFSNVDISSRVGFYDMNRFEVLLGPQGTLYGRNAEGGVLNQITNDPQPTFSTNAYVGAGNYQTLTVQGMVNVPITDAVFLRVAGSTIQQNGFLSNGQDDNHSTGARAKLLIVPSDVFSVLLGIEATQITGQGITAVPGFTSATASQAFTLICIPATNTPCPSNEQYQQHGYRTWANIKADVGIGELTVLPAYTEESEAKQATADGPFCPPGVVPCFLQAAFQTFSYGDGETNERSVEIHLASKSSSRIGWIVGYYGYDERGLAPGDSYSAGIAANGQNTYVTIINTPGYPTALSNTAYTTSRSLGYFGQITIPVFDDFRIIGGIRDSTDHASVTNTGPIVSNHQDSAGRWSHVDWKGGLQYDLTPSSMLYGTVASGYRPGGFSPAPPYPSYDIETVRSYEIGSKNEFLDHRMRVNADIYYYDYHGFQQPSFMPCVQPPNPTPLPTCTNPAININLAIENVPDVTVKGAELTFDYAITPADVLTLGGAYTNSSINSPLLVSLPPVQVEGQALPDAPRYTLVTTYRHDFALPSGKLTPQLTLSYQNGMYLDLIPSPLDYQPTVWREDASLTYTSQNEHWFINLWGRNLSNQVVKAGSNDGGVHAYLDAPRTYGITVSARY